MMDGAPAERTEVVTLPPSVTRLVVLGDPHGDIIGLEEAVAREQGPHVALFSAGDNIGYADAVISSHFITLLAARGIRSVTGNHEAWSEGGRLFLGPPGAPHQLTPEAWAWCQALPYRLHIVAGALPGLRIHLVHTFPDWSYVDEENAERLVDTEGADLVFCGHTHRAGVHVIERGKDTKVRRLDARSKKGIDVKLAPGARYVVDAGSLGRPTVPRQGPCLERGTYAALDLATRTIQLRAIDKTPRLQALMQQLLQPPPPPPPSGPHPGDVGGDG
jgi:predicted phosphodiesterase